MVSQESAQQINSVLRQIEQNIGRVIIGKSGTIKLLLVALLCEGHVLIEDVPGVGKTTLAKSLARSLDMSFQRIQFTPDLLPSDVTGINYFNQKSQEFQFRQGPIFSNVLLADEINRATPRTQSALLEAMEERQVTVDGETRKLARPFFVLATENPIELEGTFPLPEAQLDRFMLRIGMGYPDQQEEYDIARRFIEQSPLDALGPVARSEDMGMLAAECRKVYISEAVGGYIVEIVRKTRNQDEVALGASPRATLALFRGTQAYAAISGRSYVLPDDVKALCAPILGHRIVLTAHGRLRTRESADLVREIVESVPAPVEDESTVGR